MPKPRHPLIDLVIDTLRDPRAFAPRIVAWPVPAQAVWTAVLLMSVLSALLVSGIPVLFGFDTAAPLPGFPMRPTPITMSAIQVAAMIVSAAAVMRIGKVFGGKGDFNGALRITAWLQFVMVLLNVLQFAVLLILPPLGAIASLGSLMVVAWVGTGLVAGLHGFTSLPAVFVGILFSIFAIAFALAMVVALLFGAPA